MMAKAPISSYFRKNILVIFLLGISSGFPLALCFGTLTAWLTEVGIKKETIGLFGALTFPYALKFLWSPLFDAVKVPVLTKFFGKRRAWIITVQALLIASIIGLGHTLPEVNASYTALFAFIVSFIAASQDINIDAYRVELLKQEEYGMGSAAAVFGYRIGMLISGAGALYLADTDLSWHVVYYLMSIVALVGMIAVLIGSRPEIETKPQPVGGHFRRSVIEPFKDFSQRNGWLVFLFIIVLYKLPDAMLGSLANNFYLEIGFTKTQIASVSKVFGLAATLLGSFAGGIIVTRLGLFRALIIGCLAQGLTVLFFSLQALKGNDIYFLIATIGFENFGSGIGDICVVVFISNLCNKQFTATQFALLSSVSALGRTFLRTPSGYIAASTGWFWFFAISAATAIPGLIVIYLARSQIRLLTESLKKPRKLL